MARIRFLSCALTLLLGPAIARAFDTAQGTPNGQEVGTNAEATADPHLFVLMQPMQSQGLLLKIIARDGHDAGGAALTRGSDYLYDEEQGKIVLLGERRVDPSTQFLFVHGRICDPSTFLFHHPISSADVKVVLGNRRLVPGEGFTVDEQAGVLRIVDAEIGKPDARYFISAGSQAVGNRSDMDVVRRLLGEERARLEPGRATEPSAQHRSVGTNAETTADPHRFVLMQPMLSEGIVVKIIARGGRGESSDLARGRDFLYDPELGEIVLFGELRVDPSTQLLFVSGGIRDPSRFFFHRALAKEDVKVVLNDRRLALGKDFEVAEREGVVHILAADIGAPEAKFFVSAGDHSMSNGVDMRRVRELLDQGK